MKTTIVLLLAICTYQAPASGADNSRQQQGNVSNAEQRDTPNKSHQSVAGNQKVGASDYTQGSTAKANKRTDDSRPWTDYVNAFSTLVIAVFTIGLFAAVVVQIYTSRNIERAWVMAELGWYENTPHVVQHKEGTRNESTSAYVKLTCRNDGKSPAWIDNISGRVDIVTAVSVIPLQEPNRESFGNYGPMEPLGPGKEKSRSVELRCMGQPKGGEFLSAYVIVQYRDIFGTTRTTHLGYSIDSHGNINRQDAIRQRNKNT